MQFIFEDFDGDGVIGPNDIRELVDRITGGKTDDEEAGRNQLDEKEMENVIKHVRIYFVILYRNYAKTLFIIYKYTICKILFNAIIL